MTFATMNPHEADDAAAEEEAGIEAIHGAPVRHATNAAAIQMLRKRVAALQRRLAANAHREGPVAENHEISLIRELRAVRAQLATYQSLEQQRN